MNNDAEVEGRPRPLSTGLWTLFSWLRRDDRSVSSDSLSSAGSDRTVASFAFLNPAHYQPAKGPLVVPPPGPPTDSYKKRVHDRNLRRHHDRDITLHRKYGLFKSEGICSYDAFSLPPARRISAESGGRWDRERRATSECYQRRLAHVPGKRRAPLPPLSTSTAGPSASLPRRNTRKRPAPQPPGSLLEKNKGILKVIEANTGAPQMSSNASQDKHKLRNDDLTMGCKSEKYSKKDAINTKDIKNKSEKSFLKQIFDGKKRNSRIDTSAIKLLPNISELDKQAAEIIETCKLKSTENNNNVSFHKLDSHGTNHAGAWICVRCLRKYNSSVITCVFCASNLKDNRGAISRASNSFTQTDNELPNPLSSNQNNYSEDQQKLKEMLKEMKDSLPKRPKHDIHTRTGNQLSIGGNNYKRNSYSTETPTLRVGSTVQSKQKSVTQSCTSNVIPKPESAQKPYPASEKTALVAQVISAYKKNLDLSVTLATGNDIVSKSEVTDVRVPVGEPEKCIQNQATEPLKDTKAINAPLKISSLLNPMYVPKNPAIYKTSLIENVPQHKNERYELDKVNGGDKVNRISRITSVSSSYTDVVPGPSTTEINVISENIINKPNIESEKSTDGGSMSAQKEKPPNIILSEVKIVQHPNKVKDIPNLSSGLHYESVTNSIETQNQHSRRRDLINQLEISIAKGDERAAAEAAAKLAQLRLSCSVLSFSSQILSQPSTSKSNENIKEMKPNNESTQKVHNKSQVGMSRSKTSPPKMPINKITTKANFVTNNVTPSLASSETAASKVLPLPLKREEAKGTLETDKVTIAVMVEDREATRGPVHLQINRQARVRDLRQEAEASLGLATHLQRWIVGRVLCVNDDALLISLAGPNFSAPFYLCVVESETKVGPIPQKAIASKNTNDQPTHTGNVYTELVQLEQQALVPNAENFECGVCMEEYQPGFGVVLRECVHIFCRDCLSDVVRHCEEPQVSCPAMGCPGMLQEREIRALVSSQDYERWLARGLAAAESGTRNAFHCRTRDCKGWALCEPGVQRFPCPVCKCINCVPCQAIHDGDTCEQHRAKLKQEASKSTNGNETDDGTRILLNSLIRKGEALECPECSAIITKKWGCDWVKCSACKTEICWVTRGRRWGPGGKGDTSGGCRCGVDGKRCHPSCGYCH